MYIIEKVKYYYKAYKQNQQVFFSISLIGSLPKFLCETATFSSSVVSFAFYH